MTPWLIFVYSGLPRSWKLVQQPAWLRMILSAVQKWVTYSTSQYTNIDILCWTLSCARHHGPYGGPCSAIVYKFSAFFWSRTYDTRACCDEAILERGLGNVEHQEKLHQCVLFVSSFVTMTTALSQLSYHIIDHRMSGSSSGRTLENSHCHGWVAAMDPVFILGRSICWYNCCSQSCCFPTDTHTRLRKVGSKRIRCGLLTRRCVG